MKRHKLIIIFGMALVMFSLVLGCLWAQTQGKPTDIIFGYVFTSRPDVEVKDAEAALKLWGAELGKKVNHTVDTIFYENVAQLIRDIEIGKVDLASISVIDYLRAQNKKDMELAFTHVIGGKRTKRYLLLVRNDSNYGKLTELRKKKVSVLKGDSMSRVFLDTLLYRQALGDAGTFFHALEERLKPSQVVLPVMFGQSDACVIADTSFNTIVEMNPQIGKSLKAIASIPELVDTILVFRKSYRQDLKEKASRILDQMGDYPKGKQILMLFKIDDLIPVSDLDLNPTRALLAEHDRHKAHGPQRVVQSGG